MFKLFYTNADNFLGQQLVADKSLGGLLSSTEIPNDSLNNIFSDISIRTLENKLEENKLLALINKSENPINNIQITTDYQDPNSDLFIGLAQAKTDTCNNIYFDKVANMFYKPTGISFVNANTKFAYSDLEIPTNIQQGDELEVFYNSTSVCFVTIESKEPTVISTMQEIIDGFDKENIKAKIVYSQALNKDLLRVYYLDLLPTGFFALEVNSSVVSQVNLSSINLRTITINTIPANGIVGIWFRRVIKSQVYEKVEDMTSLNKDFNFYVFY